MGKLRREKDRLGKTSYKKLGIILLFWTITVFLLILACYACRIMPVNMTAILSYKPTILPFRTILFILAAAMFLGISCFAFLQLSGYDTGKLFASYVLLTGVSIGLAPCNSVNESLISILRIALGGLGGIFLFQVIAYLTLQKERMFYRVLKTCLIFIYIFGIMGKIISLFPVGWNFVYVVSDYAEHGMVLFPATFSLLLMIANYRKSNDYARRQMKILILGIFAGILLFVAASSLPELMIVQSFPEEEETVFEVEIAAVDTAYKSLPMLIFAGESIAIIFLLIHREFTLADPRLKLWHFVLFPLYTDTVCLFMFIYGSAPLWTVSLAFIFLSFPWAYAYWNAYLSPQMVSERTYEEMLLSEVEDEKQNLAIYLHDEVLQSMIAVYRKIRSEGRGKNADMEETLSSLIAGIRKTSHNLYPTIVEDLGLEQSLHICVTELADENPAMNIQYTYGLKDGILPKRYALPMYRTARELLINAVKHSDGRAASLDLEEDAVGFYIYVRDNGKGIDSSKKSDDHGSHIGLHSVRRQVAALGGRMEVMTGSSSGTAIEVFIPKEG